MVIIDTLHVSYFIVEEQQHQSRMGKYVPIIIHRQHSTKLIIIAVYRLGIVSFKNSGRNTTVSKQWDMIKEVDYNVI